jgi:hypothetical protein
MSVLALVTLRWGDHLVASRTARDGCDVAVGPGGGLASVPAGTPGEGCMVRIVGDAAVITVPAGCAVRSDALSADRALPPRGVDVRVPLRPLQAACVLLGDLGCEPAPLTLHVEVAEGGAGFEAPVSLFARGRGHMLAVGVIHAVFLLWSGRVAAVDLDTRATIALGEMHAALERAERRERDGAPPERFSRPSGPIEALDAPRSSLLRQPWLRREPATVSRTTGARITDMEDTTAFALPTAPVVVE